MNKTKRKEIIYNKLIGKINNEYYFLDYTFNQGKGFKGATGTVVEVLTEEKRDERVENYFDADNMKYLWEQAVNGDRTVLGLDDWIDLVRETDGESGVIEEATEEQKNALKELLGEEAVFMTNVRGGGRCFDENMKWDKLFNSELWEKIKAIEK